MIAPSSAAFYATLLYVIVVSLLCGWLFGKYGPIRRGDAAIIGIAIGVGLYITSVLIYYGLHDSFWRVARPEWHGMAPHIGVGPYFTPGVIVALIAGGCPGFLLGRSKRYVPNLRTKNNP